MEGFSSDFSCILIWFSSNFINSTLAPPFYVCWRTWRGVFFIELSSLRPCLGRETNETSECSRGCQPDILYAEWRRKRPRCDLQQFQANFKVLLNPVEESNLSTSGILISRYLLHIIILISIQFYQFSARSCTLRVRASSVRNYHLYWLANILSDLPVLPARDVTLRGITQNSRDTYLAKQTKPGSELALTSQFTKSPSELPTST